MRLFIPPTFDKRLDTLHIDIGNAILSIILFESAFSMPVPQNTKLSMRRLKSSLGVNIHYRTLISTAAATTDPTTIHTAVAKFADPSRRLFQRFGVELRPASFASMDIPELRVVDASAGNPSDEQLRLVKEFRLQTPGVGGGIVIFIVDSIFVNGTMPVAGCGYKAGRLSCVLLANSMSTEWTLGHELGHLFGLPHQSAEPHALMFDDTKQIALVSFPELYWSELIQIRLCPLLRQI